MTGRRTERKTRELQEIDTQQYTDRHKGRHICAPDTGSRQIERHEDKHIDRKIA